MISPKRESDNSNERCLTTDELLRYISHPCPDEGLPEIEAHLSVCASCREELAEVLKLLHPESTDLRDAPPALSDQEIKEAVALVQGAPQATRHSRGGRIWTFWAAAVAAALFFSILGAAGYRYYQVRKSNAFMALAIADLAGIPTVRSPGGLRLDLPFGSTSLTRAGIDVNALRSAEIHFSQALVADERAKAPRLGLAAVHLAGLQVDLALEEFQRVLDMESGNTQALVGRGVAAFELARKEADPVARQNLYTRALADFDNALKEHADSAEARYNRIWVLYETGRHQEAEADIDLYLSRDRDSIWAARLRELRMRMRLSKDDAVDNAVDHAAISRDTSALTGLVVVAQEKIPAAIRKAMREVLAREGASRKPNQPDSADLKWAAETLESAYGAMTGDHSWNALILFYGGLSPPDRNLKRTLDKRLFELAASQGTTPVDLVLSGSATLEPQYSSLNDIWQLFNIHSLRGNCFFLKADFRSAELEYRQMLQYAEKTNAPEMRAKALAALFSALGDLNRFDEMAAAAADLEAVAAKYRLDFWTAYAANAAGALHRKLHQPQEALEDYSKVLDYAYRNRDDAMLVEGLQALVPVMSEIGRPKDGATLCAMALEAVGSLSNPGGRMPRNEHEMRLLNLLYRQGESALDAGNLDVAESCFLAGLRGRLETMRELECRLRLGLAQVHLSKNRFADVASALKRVRSIAAEGRYEELEWQASLLEGKMRRQLGDFSGALADFTRCIDAVERIRSGIASEDLRWHFLNRRFDPYKEIVSLLHGSLHKSEKAAEFAGRAQSISLREYLGSSASGTTSDLKEISTSLETWCIEYFFAADGLMAFVFGPDRFQAVLLPGLRAEVENAVTEYLDSIGKGDDLRFHLSARRLYDQIVEPLFKDSDFERCERLVIFPDGPLHLIPFGGLQDPRGAYLLEKCEISYAPAAGVLQRCLALRRESASGRNRTVLLIDGTANLPGAGDELARISRIYPGSRFLNGRNLVAAPGLSAEADIIHFAGHSELNGGKSRLILQGPPQPLFLDSAGISSWRLQKNSLVTLAGCQTGVGPQTEGEIPWSLIPAFLSAGSPALLVSLLPVDDAATEVFTKTFYELLAGNRIIAKATAVRQAQLRILAASRGLGKILPASWLPFILVGDPR
jgi:CHAT domain-containing protein